MLGVLIGAHAAIGQESTEGQTQIQFKYSRIEWVKNWPSDDDKHRSKRFKDVVNSIIFGRKPPVLSKPVAVFATGPEEYWILDQGNKAVFSVRHNVGDMTRQVARSGFDLSSLVGICSGPNSSILFTDSNSGKIFVMMQGAKRIKTLNDSLVLEQPTGIIYSAQRKEIWVVETKAHCISVLNESGGFIRRIGRRGEAPGEFNYPTHIWMDQGGLVYVTDAMNFRVQVLNFDGKVVSVFGEAGDATGFLARPKGICTDSFGNIYVVDALFHAVQVFDLQGKFLYRFAGQGHGNSEFWLPSGIFIDAQDYIYVADTYNSRVQVFRLIHSD